MLKGLGRWWRAEDYNPQEAPGVVSRRKAYADLQNRATQDLYSGQRDLQSMGKTFGAGNVYGNNLADEYQRNLNYMDVDWGKDTIDALQNAMARQQQERMLRRSFVGGAAGDILSILGQLALSKLYKPKAEPSAMALFTQGKQPSKTGLQNFRVPGTVPGLQLPSSDPRINEIKRAMLALRLFGGM